MYLSTSENGQKCLNFISNCIGDERESIQYNPNHGQF